MVRNEGYPETLQRSECEIIPLVTYPTFPSDSPEHAQAVAEWEAVLANEEENKSKGFMLPDWMKGGRRVPLPSTGPKQRNLVIDCLVGFYVVRR